MAEAYGRSGGIAQFNRNLFEAITAHDDIELHVLALLGSATPDVPRSVTFSVPAPGNKLGFALAALRATAARRPDLIELFRPEGAGHTDAWNADPAAYDTLVSRALAGEGAGDRAAPA